MPGTDYYKLWREGGAVKFMQGERKRKKKLCKEGKEKNSCTCQNILGEKNIQAG